VHVRSLWGVILVQVYRRLILSGPLVVWTWFVSEIVNG
jgi:hypothetical protein